MFDIGATELLILAIVAIIVVGPKDLPKLLRQIGHIVSYGKKLTSDLKGQINEAVEETGIKNIQKTVEETANFDEKLVEDIEDEFFSDDAFGDVDEVELASETEPLLKAGKPIQKKKTKATRAKTVKTKPKAGKTAQKKVLSKKPIKATTGSRV